MKNAGEIILDFIARFHGSEDVFLHGCCYWFAQILYSRFEVEYGVDIFYEPVEGHFIAKIQQHFYDVRGDVTEHYRGRPMYDLWAMRRDDRKMYLRLMRQCRDFRECDEGE